jgi:hypothetical protein
MVFATIHGPGSRIIWMKHAAACAVLYLSAHRRNIGWIRPDLRNHRCDLVDPVEAERVLIEGEQAEVAARMTLQAHKRD